MNQGPNGAPPIAGARILNGGRSAGSPPPQEGADQLGVGYHQGAKAVVILNKKSGSACFLGDDGSITLNPAVYEGVPAPLASITVSPNGDVMMRGVRLLQDFEEIVTNTPRMEMARRRHEIYENKLREMLDDANFVDNLKKKGVTDERIHEIAAESAYAFAAAEVAKEQQAQEQAGLTGVDPEVAAAEQVQNSEEHEPPQELDTPVPQAAAEPHESAAQLAAEQVSQA